MRAISADSHVVEGPEVFAGLAGRFGDDAPRVMRVGDAADCIVVPSRDAKGVNVAWMCLASTRMQRDRPLGRSDGHKPDVARMDDPEIAALFRDGYAAMRDGLRRGAARGADQDVDGIDAEVLYPGYFAMFSIEHVPLLVALQKNYNDWLHDHTRESGGRLIGLAALPVQDPVAATEELRRVIALGYRGGCIPCTSPHGAPYFDDAYEPFFALAEEAGFVLSMHVGCPSWVPPEARGPRGRRDAIADYAAAQHVVQGTLVELICRGVAERHPRLQFVVAEFNAGWIAHWLDRVWQGIQREWRGRSDRYTGATPHEVWRRQFHATIEDDRPALLTRDLLGTDRLMWGSDYPHTDSTWPCSGAVLDELFDGLPDTDRARITRDNVRRLYRLDGLDGLDGLDT